DCDRVVAVYMFTVHAVTYGPVGKFFSPVLQLPWHTDCIFVVLYDAYEWQIMNADKVQTFVKITLIGRTFTECRHCNTRFVVHLELEARTNGMQHLSCHTGALGHDVIFFFTEV